MEIDILIESYGRWMPVEAKRTKLKWHFKIVIYFLICKDPI